MAQSYINCYRGQRSEHIQQQQYSQRRETAIGGKMELAGSDLLVGNGTEVIFALHLHVHFSQNRS
jgi:hypothetical protein